jgi:predicted N-formylglutamate amidohydrolase
MRVDGHDGHRPARGPDPEPLLAAGTGLLAADEPPPFELVNPHGKARVLLVCDHASNRIPRRLGDLGVATDWLEQHIAWDPGAARVARGLAGRLDAPLLLGNYSRLVIDLNRPLASPESIPEASAGVPIPGNLGLSESARAARVAALFEPYHRVLAQLLDRRRDRSIQLFSLHSFTPELNGEARPWHVGVAYGRDRRLADRVRPALQRYDDLLIGDNQPYGVDDVHDFTLPVHGEGRGLPHVMIEMRQDLLCTDDDVRRWVARLAQVCDDAWSD